MQRSVSSLLRIAATVLGSAVVFAGCMFFITQSSIGLVTSAEATQPTVVPRATVKRPSYLAPIAEIPAGTISAIQPLPLLRASVAVAAPEPEQPVDAAAGQPAMLWRVDASSLNVRGAPSSKSARVATLRRGEPVTVVEQSGSWARIEMVGGAEGWVFAKYLSRDDAFASID
jgi:uncharacterized protein YgiM (DUF1202 family)